MRQLCSDAYERAKKLIIEHREALETIAKALLEFETLDGSQVREIIDHGRMLNPPSARGGKSQKEPPPIPEGTTLSPDYPSGLTESPA